MEAAERPRRERTTKSCPVRPPKDGSGTFGRLHDCAAAAVCQKHVTAWLVSRGVEYAFYTFYGLVFAPLLPRPIASKAFPEIAAGFQGNIEQWKPVIVRQMTALLRNC